MVQSDIVADTNAEFLMIIMIGTQPFPFFAIVNQAATISGHSGSLAFSVTNKPLLFSTLNHPPLTERCLARLARVRAGGERIAQDIPYAPTTHFMVMVRLLEVTLQLIHSL